MDDVRGGARSRADAPALSQLKARIESGEIPGIHSVLVIADGKTIAEWYFDGVDETVGPTGPMQLGRVAFTPETLHDVRSVTKSVVSILFGIAYSDGAIKSLDTPVLDYFPEFADLHTPERMKVRIRDVLTMTSGLHWDERTYPYSDVRNSEIAMDIADDPYRYVLSGSIDAPPAPASTIPAATSPSSQRSSRARRKRRSKRMRGRNCSRRSASRASSGPRAAATFRARHRGCA